MTEEEHLVMIKRNMQINGNANVILIFFHVHSWLCGRQSEEVEIEFENDEASCVRNMRHI